MPKVVKSINRQLREKSIKTKVVSYKLHYCQRITNTLLFLSIFSKLFYLQIGAFSVLKELVVVLPDCLADHIGSIIPGIEKALCVSENLVILCL